MGSNGWFVNVWEQLLDSMYSVIARRWMQFWWPTRIGRPRKLLSRGGGGWFGFAISITSYMLVIPNVHLYAGGNFSNDGHICLKDIYAKAILYWDLVRNPPNVEEHDIYAWSKYMLNPKFWKWHICLEIQSTQYMWPQNHPPPRSS